ncbi:alpha/beta hydrolase family protein [Pseudorhodobacter sp. W20_MBD10_FR17]|uniref:alpha/beta hydrolase family protein n=1 Tax=Pseudorhodobacter sp. W20_MBD10_FR17 TaxID=3240266 RepID=UPI003F9B3C4A
MKYKMAITSLALMGFGNVLWAADPEHTGMADFQIAGDRPLDGYVWYPTAQADGAVGAHGNQVWQDLSVIKDAPIVAGPHPLVVFSHGMFGNANNQAWLAQALVAKGYVVAAVNHPGTSSFNKDPDQRRMLWERPKDISRVIDFVLGGAGIGAAVEPEHIFMAGHSLGGFTAMELAGARFDSATFDAFCTGHVDELVCGIFDGWDVAKTPDDRAQMQADLSDPRIAGFAVFDLGGTQSFSAASLAAIARPLLVIGAPDNIHGLDLDVESRALVAKLPKGTPYLEPASLAHFDFLGLCTAQGLELLKEEEPDDAFVCEKGLEERAADHALVADAVDAFFAGL